jgi:hypothetical protein
MKTLRMAVVPLALGLAAAIGTGALNAAAATGWQVTSELSVQGSATAVTAAGPDAEWLFASGDTITTPATAWEDTGNGWHQVRFGSAAGEQVTTATALTARDAWAFANRLSAGSSGGQAWRWNGSSWSVAHTFPLPVSSAIVVSDSDIWVFAYEPGRSGNTAPWHFNGRQWSQVAGTELSGGSASPAGGVWAYGGAYVARWTGDGWARTSLARFLPPLQSACTKPCGQYLNSPAIDGMLALSPSNVYALADSNGQDASGPWSLLHYNGRAWSRVSGQFPGVATELVSDGNGGLWISVTPGCCGLGDIDHYANGTVTKVSLPATVDVGQIAPVPGTGQFLAAATERPAANNFASQHPAVVQYQP